VIRLFNNNRIYGNKKCNMRSKHLLTERDAKIDPPIQAAHKGLKGLIIGANEPPLAANLLIVADTPEKEES
jgi:hypothetical protein